MPHTEYVPISIEIMPDVEGRPSRLYLAIDGLICQKLVARIFLTLAPGTSWDQAEQFTAALARMTRHLAIVHLAPGEGSQPRKSVTRA